jgi:hypothetical protein
MPSALYDPSLNQIHASCARGKVGTRVRSADKGQPIELYVNIIPSPGPRWQDIARIEWTRRIGQRQGIPGKLEQRFRLQLTNSD